MSQKIKKKIKRSIPWLMIISLALNTMVAGLFFNIDFNFSKNNDPGLKMGFNTAEAADTATTTVTVKNAPPALVGNVVEDPVSSSTSPVNVGETIDFKATANDPESNDYFLIVCDASDVSANNGAPPDCNAGTQFCVSATTTSGSEATCVYSNVSDPGAETDDWYAFVCDDHATEADCSLVNQGSGDSGSPIYINHAPTFTAVTTSDDNKNPDEYFTVSATATDSDTVGGADELILYVCQTDSWATTTGCAASTWCTGTSTSPNVSCQFASSTPAVDGTYNPGYYAFLMDWHGFAANSGNSRNAAYTINNVAPTVSNVVINGGADIEANMKGMAEYTASTSGTIYDANSCNDIISATSSIYLASATGTLNCNADDDDCYQIASTFCNIVSGTCTGDGDTTVDYICSTTIAFHVNPTDNITNNPWYGDSWEAGMTGFDEALSGASTSASGVNSISVEALAVNEARIQYGVIAGAQNSEDYNATTTIENYGNIPINSEIEGTHMTKGTDQIDVDQQRFDLVAGNFSGLSNTLPLTASGTPVILDIDVAKPTDSNLTVTDEVYWGINIPGGTPSGEYNGLNTFTASLDGNDW